MAGILRKLAELVVEFPDDKPPGHADGESSQDVLASIEQIRQDIAGDSSSKPDFSDPLPPVVKPRLPAAAVPANSAASGLSPSSNIRIPPVLGVQDVYAKANLKPVPDGVDCYTVEKMLADPEIADLPLDTRAKSVRMALRSMGKELPDLIADAARRDQALETYEQFLGEAIGTVEQQIADANAKLQQEIDDFVQSRTTQMEANKSALSTAQAGRDAFMTAKQAEEQRLFNIVAPFVAPGQNPVQLGGDQPHFKQVQPPVTKGGKP